MGNLTYNESYVLALILKWEPATGYFIRKSLREALASNVSDSPGKVYQTIERLKERGLVVAATTQRGSRSSESLSATPAGREAVREWLLMHDARAAIPEDPLRTRIGFLDLLDAKDAIAWLYRVEEELREVAAGLLQSLEVAADLSTRLELRHALLVTDARIAWVNEAVATLARDAV